MKIFIASLLIIVGISAAYATSSMLLLHVGQSAGNGGAGGTNFILMVDNSSRILQTDNVSKICLATGC